MTVWEIVRMLRRRWLVVLVGVAVTAALARGPLRSDSVVYSRTELVFLAPSSSINPNAIRTRSSSVIMAAGVVARRVNGPAPPPKLASPDATLVGLGTRDGWWLRLPDTGGQWRPNFTSQLLILEVVAPTSHAVKLRQEALVTRIRTELTSLEDSFGVAGVNRISVIEAPDDAVTYPVTGDRHRTLAVLALLGGSATLCAVVVTENVVIRTTSKRRAVRRSVQART